MEETKGYRDLILWKKAMDLVPVVYELSRAFPTTERYGLTDQMRRASVSIAANIAEGHGRSSGEFLNFLRIARGSSSELDTLINLAGRLNYLNAEKTEVLYMRVIEIRRLLYGLSRKVAAAKPKR